jgi:hypothetical protein
MRRNLVAEIFPEQADTLPFAETAHPHRSHRPLFFSNTKVRFSQVIPHQLVRKPPATRIQPVDPFGSFFAPQMSVVSNGGTVLYKFI